MIWCNQSTGHHPVKPFTNIMSKYEIEEPRKAASYKSPGVAAVLSALLPGLGQVYNGRFIWAIIWFIITPGLWIGTGGWFGWVCHILSAIQAYAYSKKQLTA